MTSINDRNAPKRKEKKNSCKKWQCNWHHAPHKKANKVWIGRVRVEWNEQKPTIYANEAAIRTERDEKKMANVTEEKKHQWDNMEFCV